MTQEIVDLLIVGDVLLCKNGLDLVEVPIGYVWHLVYFFWHPSHMSVQTVRAIYAKSKSVVVTLASSHSVRIGLFLTLIFEEVSAVFSTPSSFV